MLLDSHGVGGQGGPGDGVGGHQEIEGGSQDWGEETGGVQGGNKSRLMFLFTPNFPDSSIDCSGSGHGVDVGVWSW